MQEDSYYIMWRGNHEGPFSCEELIELYNNRKVSDLHQVSCNRKDWLLLKDIIHQFNIKEQNIDPPPVIPEKRFLPLRLVTPAIKSPSISVKDNKDERQTEIICASIHQRSTAFLIDFTILFFGLSAVIAVITALLYWAKFDADIIKSILYLYIPILVSVATWMYEVGLTVSQNSATPGKFWQNIQIINDESDTLTLALSNKRFFFKTLGFLLLFIGWLPVFGKNRTTLHDLMCKTYVMQQPINNL